ncbi:SWI/SNF-related matrix-associated actin-dependent regulator of chromatin subfamily A-like protein 1 [Asbolus verrucosus]|uniref:SWI/SNF-related matrix-associated actin-dependent regulator of chromatin subfamily A-like protein 1 n=1 Tax=Asbolus verrucosus TaxID=1661398 RepID=A0A482V6L0_ASBVE|nr:SWI/SNF-related matrix-associated actin-dependent regulator of chromatin subfamily A-like protein 1 [Asbolus verrucosus]
MQCTPEEIERKKRLAQQKLAQKQLQSPRRYNLENYTNVLPSPPKTQFTFKNQSARHNFKPYEKPAAVAQFYGKDKVVTGKCSLITEERFVVELSGFSSQAIDLFKTIPTRNYNVRTRNWDFHVKDHNLLITKMQSLQPNVVIDKLPLYVIHCVNREKTDYSNIDLSKIDSELASALMPFQEEGVRYGIDKNGRCLIADDMGLGKTFQALGIASYYVEDWPLLIVTTSSMKNVWEETIHRYLPSVPVMQVQYMTSGKDYIGDCKILIVSHDMMSRTYQKLLEKQFGVLIVDESHTLKSFKAKCTKAATELAKKAKRVVLLSGTPALSRPNELFSQLSLIDDKFFGNFFEYSKRYCDAKATNFGWDSSGKSNLQELEVVLMRKFMIRRTKDDVLKSLPSKTQEVVTLDVNLNEFSEEDRKCLNALAAKYQNQKKSAEKHAILLTFFCETAKIKIPSVCSYILQVLKTKQKFLVFAHHQKMLDAICNILRQKDVKYIRIDGNTTSEQRKYFVDKFQLNDQYLVAVLSITAANAGITLTAAKLVLFAELHWNPSILSQAESRAHRIGQVNPVIIKYLLAPGTADDSIWPMLQEKQKILSEVGLSKDSFDNVAVTKQQTDKIEALTEDLNITITEANTLDITSYFKSTSSESKCESSFGDNSDIFNDGFDDVLSTIEI